MRQQKPQSVQMAQPAMLTERKPGTPTKRQSGNSNWGEENKTALGNTVLDGGLAKSQKKALGLQANVTGDEAKPFGMRMTSKLSVRNEILSEVKEDPRLESAAQRSSCPLGTCIPTCRGEIAPVPLPKKLQKRLEDLQFSLHKNSKETLEGKETNAAIRREARLKELVERQRGHSKHVKELKTAKHTAQRFEEIPDYLPANLKQRLSSFRVPTADAILRNEKIVAGRREMVLETKVQAVQAHHVKVNRIQQTKSEFKDNQVEFFTGNRASLATTKLPKRLAKRLEDLNSKHAWTSEALLKKESHADKAHQEILRTKVDAVRTHNKLASECAKAKGMQVRFDLERIPDFLPANLKTRLAAIHRRTPEAIIRKERLAALRKTLAKDAVSHRAREHALKVAQVLITKRSFQVNHVLIPTTAEEAKALATPVELPERFKQRLESIAAKRKAVAEYLEKEETAATVRSNKLEGVVALCSEHNRRVEKILEAKDFQPRFSNNAPQSFLPEKLKDRLATFKRRTPDAILRRNEHSVTRAKLFNMAKANKAHAHLNAVQATRDLKKQMVENGIEIVTRPPTQRGPLPTRLQNRLTTLQSSWTPESHQVHMDLATVRRQNFLKARQDKIQVESAHVKKESSFVARFDQAPEFLPQSLKQSMAAVSRRTPAAILAKNALVDLRHGKYLESVKSHARDHNMRVEELKSKKRAISEDMVTMSVTDE